MTITAVCSLSCGVQAKTRIIWVLLFPSSKLELGDAQFAFPCTCTQLKATTRVKWFGTSFSITFEEYPTITMHDCNWRILIEGKQQRQLLLQSRIHETSWQWQCSIAMKCTNWRNTPKAIRSEMKIKLPSCTVVMQHYDCRIPIDLNKKINHHNAGRGAGILSLPACTRDSTCY